MIGGEFMKCNVGGIDRGVRAVIGAGFLIAAIFATVDPAWRIAFAAIAAVAFFTVTTRYCPFNQLIGLDTCHRKDGFLL
jgi:hypothetical protein